MEESISSFLAGLAARTPAPAGGASAALQAAQGAALLAMVARFAGDESLADELDRHRCRAIALITEDQLAYAAVLTADRADRPAALVAACAPQTEVYDVARAVIEVAETLLADVTRRVRPDLFAGVLAARSAAVVAAGNVRANLAGVASADADRMRARVADVAGLALAADALVS